MTDLALMYRILNQAETNLASVLQPATIPATDRTVTRYQLACWRIRHEGPGFTTRTPGNGDPGSGGGAQVHAYSNDPATDHVHRNEHIEGTHPERHALNATLPELADLTELEQLPDRLQNATAAWLTTIGLRYLEHLGAVYRIRMAHRAIRHVLDDHTTAARSNPGTFRHVDRCCNNLAHLTQRWGYTPAEPSDARPHDPDQLATDLTEKLCRSCLRVGHRSDRKKGDLCRWCDDFRGDYGFVPPPELVAAHASGIRITLNMIEPHRRRHRDRQKNRGAA